MWPYFLRATYLGKCLEDMWQESTVNRISKRSYKFDLEVFSITVKPFKYLIMGPTKTPPFSRTAFMRLTIDRYCGKMKTANSHDLILLSGCLS